MSWNITTSIDYIASHDRDTRTQLVNIKDLPNGRSAISITHTKLDYNADDSEWDAFQQIRVVWICKDQHEVARKKKTYISDRSCAGSLRVIA